MTDLETPASVPPTPAPSASAAPPRSSLAKRLLFAGVLVGASLFMALLLAEVFVRVAMPQPLAPPLYSETPYGFGILPNLHGLTVESDARRPYHVTTDAHGFRSRQPVNDAPTSGTRRVLVLGDSFTFGVGVEDNETFVARAEAALNGGGEGGAGKSSPTKCYELINASCPGWGTENELGYWRQQGHLLRPDLLVVVYFQNDLFDNLRNQVYRVRDGRVEPAPAPPSASHARRLVRSLPFYGFLCGHSHLVNLVRRVAASRGAGSQTDAMPTPPPPPPAPASVAQSDSAPPSAPAQPFVWPASVIAREVGIYRVLMEALLDDAARDHVPVLLVILPWTADLDGPPMPHLTEAERLAAEWEKDRPGFWLLDTYAPILAAKQRGDDLFLPVDRHFTPTAHRLVGDLLAERIRAIFDKPKEQP